MTNPVSLTLQGVSYQLPDGSFLFQDLHEQFDARPTGLVGRNGVGKSVLARILAGELPASSGRCTGAGRTHYLAQQIAPQPGQTVAALAGVQRPIDALRRIERGSTQSEDFELLGERWDIEQRLQQQLALHRLDHLRADTDALQLSGGEAMRVALIGALLSDAELLILDEPSNHLDRDSRQVLLDQLAHWRGGVIVVSHDRHLLGAMQRIVELSSLGLRSYGGGYAFYEHAKAQERAAALRSLEHSRIERRREQRALAEQQQRLEHRQAREARGAREANQASILLGRQKERSEHSSGKWRTQHEEKRAALEQRVRDAARQVDDDGEVTLLAPAEPAFVPQRIAELRGLSWAGRRDAQPRLDLSIRKAQRIGLVGPNGSGKSSLLKRIAGHTPAASGHCKVFVETAYLDQHLSVLDPARSVLEQMPRDTRLDEAAQRSRLALLGLSAERIRLPCRDLSGGERLKAALACVLYAERPAQLLLLDEPDNHLDLPSVRALEAVLRQYRGALVVVSHDRAFLDALALDTRVDLGSGDCRLGAWPAP